MFASSCKHSITGNNCDLRDQLSVVVVMVRIYVDRSVVAKILQRFGHIRTVHKNTISVCPDLDADQHQINAFGMIHLNTYTQKCYNCKIVDTILLLLHLCSIVLSTK